MAKSVNEKLRDHAISHNIDLQRYANGAVQRMLALLNRSDGKIEADLIAALSRLPKESFTVQRLNGLLKSTRDLNGKAYADVSVGIKSDLLDLTEAEAEYHHDLFEKIIPIPVSIAKVSPEAVYSAAMARPFQISKDKAVNLADYLNGLEADRAAAIRDSIRLGYINGESIDQMVRTIRGTKTQNYADGLMQAPRHHIEGMVRTAVNHTSNFTSQRFYEANTDLVKGVQWLSTLDVRTSLVCASRDGKIYPVNSGPRPPAHLQCRSTTVVALKSWRELGLDMDEFKSTRASMDGQVPEDITFGSWLKTQSTERQNEVLGPTRAKLFRSGEPIDKFVNDKGKVYTIEQLRERNKEVFSKLGL